MRKIKEVLLKFEAGLSHECIAAAVGLSKGAVSNYVQRCHAGWAECTALTASGCGQTGQELLGGLTRRYSALRGFAC